MAANEVRILVTADDRASGAIEAVKTRTVAAGVAIGNVLSDVGQDLVRWTADAITSFADVGSQIYDLSARTGLGAEALSELKFAAEQSGSSLEGIETALRKMNSTLYDAGAGSDTAARALDGLGLSLSQLEGGTVQDNFDKILVALSETEDATTRAALATDIFGRSGTQLLPMLAQGVGGLEDMRNKAHELGVVFDTEAAAKADAMGDAMDELKARMHGLAFQAGAALGPALVNIAAVLVNVVSAIANSKEAMVGFAVMLGGTAVAAAAAFVAAIGAVPIAIAVAVAAVGAGLTWIVRHMDTVRGLWNSLWESMPGPMKWVLEQIGAFVTGWVDNIRKGINLIIDAINWFTSQINKIKLPDWLGGGQANIGEIPHVEELAGAIGGAISDGIGMAMDSAKGLWADLTKLPDLGGKPFEGLAEGFNAAGEAAKGLTDAEKALDEARKELARTLEDIQQTLIDDQIEAYQEGGTAQLEAVKKTQAEMMVQVQAKAAELQTIWGLQFPDALSRAFAIVKSGIDAIAESAKKLQDFGLNLLQQNAQRNVRYAPGVLESIAAATGLNSFDGGGYVDRDQLALVHAGERVLTPEQQMAGGGTVNVTINVGGGVVDGASVGVQIAEYLTRAFKQNGAVLPSGIVAS